MLDKNQARHDKFLANEICYTRGEFRDQTEREIYAEEYVIFYGLQNCAKKEMFRFCDRCK